MEYASPKGVFDILPTQTAQVIRKACEDFGFSEIRTPLFEKTELFLRGVGESSDIVSKEMYTFTDKGGRSLTLRPEGTASAMRAFVDHQLAQQSFIHKFFYIGPMFRYERPQSGRYRQHHQFGAEAIGVSKPEQDAEMIDLFYEIYRRLGLRDLKVMINSVGDRVLEAPICMHLKPI
jgi:histidyl-tRNA synthetase